MVKLVVLILWTAAALPALAQSAGFLDLPETNTQPQVRPAGAYVPPIQRRPPEMPSETQRPPAATPPRAPVIAQTVAPTAPPAPRPEPRRPTALEQFRCENRRYTDSMAQATELFREALGVDSMRGGRYIVENQGYSGTRAVLKIQNSDTVQLRLVSHGYDIAGKVCARAKRGGGYILEMSADISGFGNYTITITNPRGRRNSLHLAGSGASGSVLNFGYTVQSHAPAER